MLVINGCTWIKRDYYFKSNHQLSDWSYKYVPSNESIKQGVTPAKEVLTLNHSDIQVNLHISYQDMTVFGPIIVPIIPMPWDYMGNLTIIINVKSKKNIILNPRICTMIDLSTEKQYHPEKNSY
jgi:hypothetical protein